MKTNILKNVYFLFLVLSITQLYGCSKNNRPYKGVNETVKKEDNMKIKIIVGDRSLTATLDDNPTTRDFIALLPFTVKLQDYASTEKVFTPAKKLSIQGAPAGVKPTVGDISYYAPWGNIAIFYKDFSYSEGLVKIGHIDNGEEAFQISGSIDNVRFERIEEQ
ncbi:cyclophilin-like fold protein [Chryseobacterium sp. W4I1]|uniref:cyclophilin-like fold protein n=1 Tax=Chryseobacterium sp. W4I1 TaxID=3042293 RepID=UPI0027890180|nr:cyclophilin-like fold protein [Chryseobacterium sp. W4I1]MDQ0781409.1 hypothetical protein [Chryseobacterium sp. W4I1]